MTPISNLNVGEVISFETIAPSILQLKYSQIKFGGVVNWAVARSFSDIASLHRALYQSMDQNTVKDDYRSYDYVTFQDPNSDKPDLVLVLGIPWIQADTVEVSGHTDLSLIFPNMSPDRHQYLFQLLRANGFRNFQVTGD